MNLDVGGKPTRLARAFFTKTALGTDGVRRPGSWLSLTPHLLAFSAVCLLLSSKSFAAAFGMACAGQADRLTDRQTTVGSRVAGL